jgi:ribosomal protein S18 acetylase RimI-like enzyme
MALDADAIAAHHLASWRSAYRGIIADAFLDGPARENRLAEWRNRFLPENAHMHRVRLATTDDRIVGLECVSTKPDPEWGYVLDNLHVHPGSKGLGIGRMLFRDAATWIGAKRPGAWMHLWVYELNTAARGFYERMGGEATGRATGRASDGSDAVAVRYVWRDLDALFVGPRTSTRA